MSSNNEYTVQLKESQYQYLTKIKEEYYLPDESKALRCLVNFAIEKGELEQEIFEELRCRDC